MYFRLSNCTIFNAWTHKSCLLFLYRALNWYQSWRYFLVSKLRGRRLLLICWAWFLSYLQVLLILRWLRHFPRRYFFSWHFLTLVIVSCERLFKCINKLLFLLFYVLFVCVSHKVYVLSQLARSFIFWWIKWILFFKFVETSAIYLCFELRTIGCLFLTKVLPIDTSEKLVLQDFLNSVTSQSIFRVTH